ncbi:MAG: hypothetical protein ABSH36_05670, partial [Solirubrobacteraceae bacterium]
TGGLSRVQKRAKPANSASTITTINSTSSLARAQTQQRSTPTVRGGDRRITRWIGRWAYEQRDANDRMKFAGIRYLSRLSSEWECWALFENVALDEQERRPIPRNDEALLRIAELYGLTVF